MRDSFVFDTSKTKPRSTHYHCVKELQYSHLKKKTIIMNRTFKLELYYAYFRYNVSYTHFKIYVFLKLIVLFYLIQS